MVAGFTRSFSEKLSSWAAVSQVCPWCPFNPPPAYEIPCQELALKKQRALNIFCKHTLYHSLHSSQESNQALEPSLNVSIPAANRLMRPNPVSPPKKWSVDMGCGANFKDGRCLEGLHTDGEHVDIQSQNYNLLLPVCSGDLGQEAVADPGARTERYEIRSHHCEDDFDRPIL